MSATRWLSFAELDERAARFDGIVAATPEIDHYCSCSDWILPAQRAFAPEAEPQVLETDDGFAALMSVQLPGGGRAAMPLEANWGLASAIIGPPERVLDALLRTPDGPPVMVLSGVATAGRTLEVLARRARCVSVGSAMIRVVADLTGGVDGFLGRRSAKFRATTRRARRAAAASGIRYERLERVDLDRLLAVERRSWKSREQTGIDEGPMLTFYQHMFPRLAERHALRVVFASRDGLDVAYCVGGLFGDTYRGLQASFDDDCAVESPGVLVHMEMIERLCDEGIRAYDLGSDMEYKRRWGEPSLETQTILVVR